MTVVWRTSYRNTVQNSQLRRKFTTLIDNHYVPCCYDCEDWGRPEPYIHSVMYRESGRFPAKITVHTSCVYGSGQLYMCVLHVCTVFVYVCMCVYCAYTVLANLVKMQALKP